MAAESAENGPVPNMGDGGAALSEQDAKKREANRKKREKAKAKKAEAKAAATTTEEAAAPAEEAAAPGPVPAPTPTPAPGPSASLTNEGRWMKGMLPGGRAERRDAGDGRGLGVFANEAIAKDEVVASAVPSLSVIFDQSVDDVCGFCFAAPEKGASEECAVELRSSDKGFGIQLDTTKAADGSAATIVTRVTNESPNRGLVQIGDTFATVDGAAVGGHEATVPLLQAAVKERGAVRCVVRRPSLLSCPGCKRFSVCAACVGAGRMRWHTYECSVYQTFNGMDKVKRG